MGPGRYQADAAVGIARVEDLPEPVVEKRSRNFRSRACPQCGRAAPRRSWGGRVLHEVGSLRQGCPRDVHVFYSKHRCSLCQLYFNADMSDLAPPGSHYTHRVISLAVRLVVEDGLPYRLASWHLWRDHRVFVPYATIQNWIEASGKKSGAARRRLP
jgi:hypothetical protein